jgi:hypothetical protein
VNLRDDMTPAKNPKAIPFITRAAAFLDIRPLVKDPMKPIKKPFFLLSALRQAARDVKPIMLFSVDALPVKKLYAMRASPIPARNSPGFPFIFFSFFIFSSFLLLTLAPGKNSVFINQAYIPLPIIPPAAPISPAYIPP